MMMTIRSGVTRAGMIAALGWVAAILPAQTPTERPPLPYRFLLVINDQWSDPASHIVEGDGEFPALAAVLKSWGLPFEILRLDQQHLDPYHLLERNGESRYGTIIWAAGAAPGKALEFVADLVRQHGANMVVLGAAIAAPVLSDLAGMRQDGDVATPEAPVVVREHFITRSLDGGSATPVPAGWTGPGWAATANGATALMQRGPHPFLAVRQEAGAGRVAWLGVHPQEDQIRRQFARDLLKRCLVWANGYALYAEYARSVIMFMDDMGTSDKTYYPGWHYLTPSEATIRTSLIEPLQRHHAVLVQNVTTGFLDRKSRRVLNPWQQQHVVDELDPTIIHDYASTKRGLEAGVAAGVFEIQCHGWTHMIPDLDSPPGPFWSAPARSPIVQLNWYQEFGDVVRKQEIPAAWQTFHLRRAREGLQSDFGVRPQFLMVPGHGHGTTYPNHTARIAAQLGFGLSYLAGGEYLSPELVVSLKPVVGYRGWAHDRPFFEIPWNPDAPYFMVFHDRDPSLDPGWVGRLLVHLGKDVRYLTAAEYCAYLHARVERAPAVDGAFALRVHYDETYCGFFQTHPSSWVLHLADEMRSTLPGSVLEKTVITVRPGLGTHRIRP